MQADASIDFLIVGAGFAGLVVAERLCAAGWKCVVIDRRSHIGGNAHDTTDAAGVLIHSYGPHYFRTNSRRVVDYLSKFTEWHPVEYRIKSFTGGRYWSFPVNLGTFEEWLGKPATGAEFEQWLAGQRVPCENPRNSEEAMLATVGREFYQKFFEGYTIKQWQRHPRELDASVCGRIPLRTDRDDRYLSEDFQALPKNGYTSMFDRMIDAAPGLEVRLGVDFAEARRRWDWKHLVFTGPLDEYFGRRHGALPYRTLRFEPESFDADRLAARQPVSGKRGFWQPAVQVNYPDATVPFTRIVEIKHVTGQRVDATTIVREYPKEWLPGDEPFYPIPAPASREIYQKYAELAGQETGVSFIGRLATYRYYNMDQVTAMALAEADKLLARFGTAP